MNQTPFTSAELFDLVERGFKLFGLLPDGPIKLNEWETITDPAVFVDGHCQFVTANIGKQIVQPYAERLSWFLEWVENGCE